MRPIRTILALGATALLAGCAPPIPDSGPRGVGFDTQAQFEARREAQLTGRAPLQPSYGAASPVTGPFAVGPGTPAPLPGGPTTEAEILAERTRAALGQPAGPVFTPAPTGPVTGPAIALDRDNPTISREQDFAAVSAQRDIAADAERLRIARQQYELVTPTELQRPDSTGPNIFAYALGPARPKGTQGAYRRGFGANANRAANRCGTYSSDDAAQMAFLEAGGPSRDRLGLDPDGDGNACGWDPAVVRRLVRN